MRMLDWSFGGRTEQGHEMAAELVSRADFRCVLHHFSSRPRLEGYGAKFGRKAMKIDET